MFFVCCGHHMFHHRNTELCAFLISLSPLVPGLVPVVRGLAVGRVLALPPGAAGIWPLDDVALRHGAGRANDALS